MLNFRECDFPYEFQFIMIIIIILYYVEREMGREKALWF